jgi:hypothetical protein
MYTEQVGGGSSFRGWVEECIVRGGGRRGCMAGEVQMYKEQVGGGGL